MESPPVPSLPLLSCLIPLPPSLPLWEFHPFQRSKSRPKLNFSACRRNRFPSNNETTHRLATTSGPTATADRPIDDRRWPPSCIEETRDNDLLLLLLRPSPRRRPATVGATCHSTQFSESPAHFSGSMISRRPRVGEFERGLVIKSSAGEGTFC